MPLRHNFTSIALEEVPVNDEYESDSLLGSDDDLDDTSRAAKRRRIETLGQLYLQGQPLFIASASLRGPFDSGWANPWKKNRSRQSSNHKAAASGLHRRKEKVAREAEDSEKRPRNLMGGKNKAHHADYRGHSVSSTLGDLGRQQRGSPFVVEPSDSHMTEPSSVESVARHRWLKKDRNSFNIQNYDPPKSPSSRYPGYRDVGSTKQLHVPNQISEPRRLHNVSPSKSTSSDVRWRSPTLKDPPKFTDPTRSISKSTEHKVQTTPSILADDGQNNKPLVKQETAEPTTTSSVHIVPPSSHLPEFKYRLPKSNATKQSILDDEWQIMENKTVSLDDSSAGSITERNHSSLQTGPRDGDSRQASIQKETSSDTRVAMEYNDGSESSERITSAQIVSRPQPNSGQIISLYSTDLRDVSDAGRQPGVDVDELSTQEALQLAQKSFQEDFLTPDRDIQDIPEANDSLKLTTKRITPFSRISSLPSKLAVQPAIGAGLEVTRAMDTQAMIDSITPFSVGTTKNAELQSRTKSRLDASAPDPTSERKTSPTVSPPPPVSGSPPQVASNIHTEVSRTDSFSGLPLALSVTTPATELQDGQEVMAGADTFDLSQVIQDAGSWLQQSFDIGKDIKQSGQGASQPSPSVLRREVSPT